MLLSAAVTGEGLVSSASLVRGVLPNRQVPTPSGEGNVMADATQREPVRGPEPVAKRATKNSGPAGWWLVSALQGLKRLRSTIWCSSTPLEVLTDLCDGLGCVCVSLSLILSPAPAAQIVHCAADSDFYYLSLRSSYNRD